MLKSEPEPEGCAGAGLKARHTLPLALTARSAARRAVHHGEVGRRRRVHGGATCVLKCEIFILSTTFKNISLPFFLTLDNFRASVCQ